MKTRGLGFVYQPAYVDKRTGEGRTASTWWLQYSVRGKRYRESIRLDYNRADAVKKASRKRRIGEAVRVDVTHWPRHREDDVRRPRANPARRLQGEWSP